MNDINYFPPNVFAFDSIPDSDFLHKFTVRWYSKFLYAMDEPSLWHASQTSNIHAYRFLWLPSFEPPVVARMQIDTWDSRILVAKTTDGQGGYEPGNLIINRTFRPSVLDINEFLSRLVKLEFWKKPTVDDRRMGLDGAEWILEGARYGSYHVLTRWSPEEGDFREAALTLAEMAELSVEPDY